MGRIVFIPKTSKKTKGTKILTITLTKTRKTPLNDLDVTHPTHFAAKTYLKMSFQIAFTSKLRTPRVLIIQRQKHKKHFFIKTEK